MTPQEILRELDVFSDLDRLQERHPLVGGVRDDRRAAFKQGDAQELVMIGRLFVRRDAQPLVIGIKSGHSLILAADLLSP